MVLLIPAHISHPYLTLAIITAHFPNREYDTFTLHLRNVRVNSVLLSMQGHGGTASRHFRPLCLGSGMPWAKAWHSQAFLSSVANVLVRSPTPSPFSDNTFISQLSPWLRQSARPNRRPQCTHTDKSSRLTHKEILCDKAALGDAVLICKDLFSLVGRGWSFIWTVIWWGGIQTSITKSSRNPACIQGRESLVSLLHQSPLQSPTQPLSTICCALWTEKSIFW